MHRYTVCGRARPQPYWLTAKPEGLKRADKRGEAEAC
jgi:hypothetical protein